MSQALDIGSKLGGTNRAAVSVYYDSEPVSFNGEERGVPDPNGARAVVWPNEGQRLAIRGPRSHGSGAWR